ncbi:MAG: hypothetical protein JWN22_1688 [Nocardioides sp.]|jgi:hypothetical protein|nr:hypothetical protein [Nocardioides sp.]
MRATRAAVGALGVLAGAYGAWLLLSRLDPTQLTSAALWLAGGVVLHDFVLTPLVLVGVLVVGRVLPRHAHAPAVVGLVVLGAVTLLAIPVLGRFGARPDNPTLLDRSYGAGWLVLAGLTVVAVVVASLVVRSRHRVPAPTTEGSPRGPRPGGG